jgi:Zn-finger nucleic acid-binding protein
MSAGLFSVTCPQCDVDMVVDEAGTGRCPTCDQLYLHRFGHLVVLPQAPDTPAGASPSTSMR